MATGDCEKFIDQVTDPKNLNDQCRQHIKTCGECAAIVACMVWVKTKGSPTAGLQPSQSFLSRIEQTLNGGGCGGAGGGLVGGSSNLLAWVLGIVLAASVALGGVAIFSNSSLPGASPDSGITGKSAELPDSTVKTESRILNTQQVAPVLKFPSPADDAD